MLDHLENVSVDAMPFAVHFFDFSEEKKGKLLFLENNLIRSSFEMLTCANI